ncbi:MAG: type II secretion system major pseudopilin GspG [Acidiferrobacterales bacterium]|jgi:general secretion pathway protein G|nr:type II secretion system major pseudopilin GspG [Acidiferrobacterales bacterium]
MHSNLKQRGFTLLEILVVVVILGILASLVLPNFLGRTDQARTVAAKHDIQTLVGVLKLYKLDNGFYPSTAQGLQALLAKPDSDPVPRNWKQPYIEQLPKDPWDRPYQYLNPGVHGAIDVFTLGADGESGGEDSNADIGNWDPSAK